MYTMMNRLSPHCAVGLGVRREGDTFILHGLDPDKAPELLKQLKADWTELCRQEALARLQSAAEVQRQALRPANYSDLATKTSLGRLKPEEVATLNTYYDALEAIEETVAGLAGDIAEASVTKLNAMPWPQWMTWETLVKKPQFELE